MNPLAREFVSQESRKYPFKIGQHIASGLSGFVIGVIAASIIWALGIWYLSQAQKNVPTASAASSPSASAQTHY